MLRSSHPHRFLSLVLACLLLLLALPPVLAADPTPDGQRALPDRAEQARVVRVVDGDTIYVELDGEEETVRLIGIDTPETVEPNTPEDCWGAEASDHATRLLEGRTVWLERDVSKTDRYDRLLRNVWFKGKSDSRYYLASEVLVLRGYAVVSTYPPDVAYVDRLTDAQREATAAGRGLWSACGGADAPAEPVAASGGDGVAQEAPITTCDVFASFAEAGNYYAGRPDTQPYLDPNADGRACEIYFGVDSQAVGVAFRGAVAADPDPAAPAASGGCDPSYPTICLSIGSADLDCGDIGARRFTVIPPDPHGFDGDSDGIGCESG